MTSEEFDKQYKALNSKQKEAVDAIEGSIMVVAGPGTGKTKTLTLRIANILLKTQVNPENILALTFTEAAAFEMRKRLIEIIGQEAYRVDITTFHSFSNSFIKNHQEEFAQIISSVNINEVEQLEIIGKCIEKLPLIMLKPQGDLEYYYKHCLQAINELKREGVTPETFGRAIDDMVQDINSRDDLFHEKGAHKGKMKSSYQKLLKDIEKNKELLKVYEAYQEVLLKEKKYDYNDMLLVMIEKLQSHPYLLQYIQERYQYFLVDEHQDTNASQNKLVELICSFFENPNLFVVGDEKQAIFRFQGATLENFIFFKKRYPEARLINLSENYRSTQTILKASSSLIENNTPSNLVSERTMLTKKSSHKEEPISFATLASDNLESHYIAKKVEGLLKSTSGDEIAILVRNNRDTESLISVFDSLKIPYVIEADSNILEDINIQKLIQILRVANEPYDNNLLSKAMLLDVFNIFPLDVFKIVRSRFDEKIPLWELLLDNEKLNKLNLQGLDEIKNFIEFFSDSEKGIIKLARNERFDSVFIKVLNESGLLKSILKKNNSQEILLRISRLYDDVQKEIGKSSVYSLSDFIKYIDLIEKHKINLKQNRSIIPPGLVRIMTVHKAKGLEFDYVFIPHAYDNHWGNLNQRGNVFKIPWQQLSLRIGEKIEEENNEDERRLFYVALTRSKKKVFITYSTTDADGRERLPSQFISEISKELIEAESVENYEQEMKNHPEQFLMIQKVDKERFVTKDFVKELFARQGMSVSALNNYLCCPWQFFFVNLIRLPEKIDDPGLFGNAVHNALNQYIIALKKKNASKKLLIDKFKESLMAQPITKKEFSRYEERGENALGSYYENEMKNWNDNLISELDIKGIRINESLFLNGKIDMINPLDKKMKCEVTDFKTGKIKTRNEIMGNTKGSDGNYYRQLVFYKILLDRYHNNIYKMQNGIIEFVEPHESGQFKREIFQITREESEQLLKEIITIANDIINLNFWDVNCKNKDCEYCDLKEYIN